MINSNFVVLNWRTAASDSVLLAAVAMSVVAL
jgi:hypothetical protein